MLALRLSETEQFRLQKVEEMEREGKRKVLEGESLKTLDIKVQKEFNQEQF